MSHKEPMLYRAPKDAGYPNEWEADHFIRLGPLASLQAQLAEQIAHLSLEKLPQQDMATGEVMYRGTSILVTVHLDPGSDEVIWLALANSTDPSLLDWLKTRFGLTAFDFESGEYI